MSPGGAGKGNGSGVRVTELELAAWGRRIGAEARPPVFIGLTGPMGAGKSVLARAIGAGAGVRETMPSPTFNLVFRYALPGRAGGEAGRGAGALAHADLYRIGSASELREIGWEEIVGDEDAIVVVEWPERAAGELPPDRWEMRLRWDPRRDDRRLVAVERLGHPTPLPAFPLVAR